MASLRPKLITEPEMRFAQLLEGWAFAARIVEPDTSIPWEPTSATITVTDATKGALDPAVSGASMTVVGEEITYTLASGSLPENPQRNMRAEITATDGTDTWTWLHLFDAVRFSPRMAAGYAEIARGVPGIARLAPPEDPSNEQLVREAWEDVLGWLQGLGVYPQLVLDSAQLARGHVYRARQLIYGRVARDDADAYAFQEQRWMKEWDAWRETLALQLDVNQDAAITGDEAQGQATSLVAFGRREV